MLDITPLFNELLQKHSAPPSRKEPPSVDDLDDFIKEAYRINSHIFRLHNELRDVRQAYLSTAVPRMSSRYHGPGRHRHHHHPSDTALRPSSPPAVRHLTDRDREEIDATAKKSIRELNAGIRALDDAENLRRATGAAVTRSKFVRGLGVLGAWAAGSGSGGSNSGKSAEHAEAEARAREVAAHRDGVLLFLRRGLEECCAMQRVMMERRLAREMEKNRSVLAKAGRGDGVGGGFGGRAGQGKRPGHDRQGPPPRYGARTNVVVTGRLPVENEEAEGSGAGAGDRYGNGNGPAQLSQQQMMVFEKSNQEMMTAMEAEMVKIQAAQQSLVEISELQTTLLTNLEVQAEQIDLLTREQEQADADVRGGNRELKAAAERGSTARMTFYVAAAVCAFSVVCNLVW